MDTLRLTIDSTNLRWTSTNINGTGAWVNSHGHRWWPAVTVVNFYWRSRSSVVTCSHGHRGWLAATVSTGTRGFNKKCTASWGQRGDWWQTTSQKSYFEKHKRISSRLSIYNKQYRFYKTIHASASVRSEIIVATQRTRSFVHVFVAIL